MRHGQKDDQGRDGQQSADGEFFESIEQAAKHPLSRQGRALTKARSVAISMAGRH
jgi:hypothetical protein